MERMAAPRHKLQLEDLLLRHGAVSEEQLALAREDQKQYGGEVGRILVDRGIISEGLLLRVLSHQLGIPLVDPEALELAPEALQAVPVQICERYGILPVGSDQGTGLLRVATPDPGNRVHQQELEAALGRRVALAAATAQSIELGIRRHYYGEQRKGRSMAKVALRRTPSAHPEQQPSPRAIAPKRVAPAALQPQEQEDPPEAQIVEEPLEVVPVSDESFEQPLPSLEPESIPEVEALAPEVSREEWDALSERVRRLEAFVTQPQFAAALARVERLEQIAAQLAQAVRVIGGVIIDHELVSLEEYRRRTGQK
jgi:Type II secretion system (T2SS), protein E, N-terminal domain